MKILIIIQLVIIGYLCFGRPPVIKIQNCNDQLLNMSNTMNPIISMIAENLGEYENLQTGDTAIAGKLIYKREIVNPDEHNGHGCVNDYGNVYYIRVHEWYYEDDKVWYKALKDIPLGCFSCIAEKDVLIPYWDEKLQNAVIGEKYHN